MRLRRRARLGLDVHNFAHKHALSHCSEADPGSCFAAICALLAVLLVSRQRRRRPRASSVCAALQARLVHGGGRRQRPASSIDGETGRRPVCARAAQAPAVAGLEHEAVHDLDRARALRARTTRIATKLLDRRRIDLDGVLRGSLYLQGGGDPALGTPAFYDRYRGGLGTNLFALKRQIRAAGVRTVTGRLYADDSVFDRLRGVADSGYATSPYIGPLSGLSFNSGYRGSSGAGFASDPGQTAATTLARALRAAGVAIRRRSPSATAPPAGTDARQRSLADPVAAGRRDRRLLQQLLRRDAGQAARRPLRRRRHDRGRHGGGRALRPRPRLRRPRGRRLRPDPRQPRLAAPGGRACCRRCARRRSATSSSRTWRSPATRGPSPTACTAPPPTAAAAPRPAP